MAGAEEKKTESKADEKGKVVLEKKDENIAVTLRLSTDRLKLFLDCRKLDTATTHIVTSDQILALLGNVRPESLHEGILDDVAREVTEGKEVLARRIAKGKPAVDGRDARTVLLVKKYQNKPQNIEFVDRRFVRSFDNVELGSVVGRLYPPTSGTDGVDAMGGALKSKSGKPAKVAFDETIKLEPAGTFENLVAQRAGYLHETSGKLTVVEELVLEGDVGFKTGDIDFIGAVKVKGSVLKDFTVCARKDVTIGGNAVNSSVASATGSVSITGSAYGALLTTINAPDTASSQALGRVLLKEGAHFRSAGTFRVTTCQGVSVEAVGDIEIGKEASNSILHTKSSLRMPEGHLFGGTAYTVCGVDAKILGTKQGSHTKIVLCSDIESSVEFSNLLYEIERRHAAEEILKLHLGPYAENPARIQRVGEPHRSKLAKLLQKWNELRRDIAKLEEERKVMLASAHHNPLLRVNFHEMIYQGVEITVGEERYTPEHNMRGPGTIEFLPLKRKFVVTELKPVECVVENSVTPNIAAEKTES